jgi:hypothetical protein
LALHPHAWIRQASSRVIGACFGSMSADSFADDNYAARTLIGEPKQLFELVIRLLLLVHTSDETLTLTDD